MYMFVYVCERTSDMISSPHLRKNFPVIRFVQLRYVCSSAKSTTKSGNHERHEEAIRRNTIVSQPHPVSNLRLTVYPAKRNPTEAEKMFYQVHRETQDWNQSYWEKHNTEFQQSKSLYIEDYKRRHQNSSEGEPVLTAEEMSHFYKMFLDKNHAKHVRYNWEWYQKNFYLLWLSLKASISRVLVNLKIKKTPEGS